MNIGVKMSSVKQLYSQSLIYGLSTVAPRFINYLLVPIHTNVLTNPQQYGVITEFYAYISFFIILLTFGLETAYFRFINKHKGDDTVYNTAFTFVITLTSLFVLTTLFFSGSISNLLGSKYLPLYVNTTALILAIDAISALPFAKLRNSNRPIVFSAIKLVGVTINLLSNLFFYLILEPNLILKYVQNADILYFVFLSNLIQNIVVLILVLFYTGLPRIEVNKRTLTELLKYSFPILLAGLSGTTNEAFDRLFIKYLLPSNVDSLYQLGIYSANVKLAVLLILFVQMYRFAAEPFFFKTAETDEHKSVFGKSLKFFIIISIIISILITFNLPILKYFIGPNYRESLYIIPILLLANIFYGIFFNLSFWYKLSDKTIYGLKYTLIGSAITFTSNFILIPLIGIYGAALSRVLTYMAMSVLSFIDGRNSGYISIDTSNSKIYTLFLCAIILISSLILVLLSSLYAMIISNIFIFIYIVVFIKKERIVLWRK